MSARAVLRWIALGAGIIFGLVLLLVLAVIGTEWGGRLLVSAIDHPRTPLRIERFSGRLGGRFELHGVRIDTMAVAGSIERVAVAWHPLALARKRLVVDSLTVAGVELVIRESQTPKAEKPKAPPDSVPAKIELPIQIELGELRIERARIQAKAAEIELAELRAGGGLEAYWLEAAARVTAGKLTQVPVTIAAKGAADHAEIEALRAELLRGQVEVTGRAAWHPAVSWEAAAAADSLTPGLLLAEPEAWPGSLSLRARSTGRIERGAPHAQVTLESLTGSLRGYPVAGSAELALAGRQLAIDSIDLSWGAAGLQVAGRAAETIDLTFAVETTNLGIALPGASGRVSLDGRASGPRASPRLALALAADSLAVSGQRIASVRSDVDCDLNPSGNLDLTLAASGIETAGKTIDAFAARLQGGMRAHELVASARGDSLGLAVDLALAGGLVDSTWQGEIRRLAIDSRLAGVWGLAGPASVRAGKHAGSIAGFRLIRSGDSADSLFAHAPAGDSLVGQADNSPASGNASPPHLALDGSWAQAGASRGRIEVAHLPLALFGSLLPADWSLRGTGELRAECAIDPETRLNGTATLDLADGALTLALPDTTDTIGFTTRIQAQAGAGGVKGDLAGEFMRAGASFGQLDGVVALPHLTRLASLSDSTAVQPLTGTVHLQFRDLGPLALVTPAIEHLAGKLDLQAKAAGHLRAPEITARVTLADGAADIPPAGLKLRAIELTAEGDQHQLAAQGRLQSGNGFLALTAKAPRIDADSLELQVKIQGERFTVMGTPEVEVLISPDLEAAVVGRKAEVRGEVLIPFARIELKQIPPSAQGVSGDVEFVDAEAEEEKPPIEVTADVRVALGDSVSFSGYGFSSRFAGGVQVSERPGQPTSASGELRVEEGKYRAYGQNLTVGTWGDSLKSGSDPGRIIFAGGPANNPGLDLRAFREAEDGTIAGLHILGTAKRPEITLFSDPAMPDGDVLSYIMLGRKPGESGGDSSLLANAAVGMGLSRGNVMARSLGSKVGLDQAGIESEGGIDEAALVTGKYLSPKLYVSHGYGLFDRTNTFRARYLLKKEVTVQAETGEGSGGDILYRLERGR